MIILASSTDQIAKTIVRSGVRTHALFRGPDLESGALDRSAILTVIRPTLMLFINGILLYIYKNHQ